RLVTVSWDGTARLWEVATGECLHTFDDPAQKMLSAAFSPNGAYLIMISLPASHSVSDIKEVKKTLLWEVASGRKVAQLPGAFAAFSPDTRALATVEQQVLYMWEVDADDISSLSRRFTLERWFGEQRALLVFSPDGTYFSVGPWGATVDKLNTR